MTVESRKRYMVNYNKSYYKRNHGIILQRQTLYREKNRVKTNQIQRCRLLFKDEEINLGFNPRKGICSECGKSIGVDIKVTHIHHDKYHDDSGIRFAENIILARFLNLNGWQNLCSPVISSPVDRTLKLAVSNSFVFFKSANKLY